MHRARRTGRVVVAVAVALLAFAALPMAPVRPSIAVAASATTVDVSPEHGSGRIGETVTLTARVYDETGALYSGPATSTHVRFYFAAGSPNDIASPGNSPDLDCMTGEAGECSVSYEAAAAAPTSSARSSAARPASVPRRA
jgi:hypothetical protein